MPASKTEAQFCFKPDPFTTYIYPTSRSSGNADISKCNKGQPCSNCARRFPQPVCEYRENRDESVPNTASFSLSQSPYQDEGVLRPSIQQPVPPLLLNAPPTQRSVEQIDSGGSGSGYRLPDFGTETRPPEYGPQEKAEPLAWGTVMPTNLPHCEADCVVHSRELHKAVNILMGNINRGPIRYITPGSTGIAVKTPWWRPKGPGVNTSDLLPPMSSSIDLLNNLPLERNALNAELIHIHINLICRFKSSLDGNTDPNSLFSRHYLPLSIQNPFVAQASIYTAALFLKESHQLDPTVAMDIKGQTIRKLNELSRSEQFVTGDEAIAAVYQMISNEFNWGDVNDWQAHLEGMRQMVRIRGGFQNLGMGGLLSKMVIILDRCIAISYESPPYFQKGAEEFEYVDASPGPFRAAHNTPLVKDMASFESCAEALKLHPTTARILDDVRFLIDAIVSLPADASAQDNQKVQSTSRWIHERILALPADSPLSCQSNAPPMPGPSSGARSSPGNNQGLHVGLSLRNDTPSTERDRTSEPHPSSSSSTSQPPKSTTPTPTPNPPLPPPPPPPDPIYQSIRRAALLYTTSITTRQPLSQTCTATHFFDLWTSMWRTPLTTWKSMVGVFLWAAVAVAPAASKTPQSRFVKSMLNIAALDLGVGNWEAVCGALDEVVGLQVWLGGGGGDDGGKGKGKGKERETG